MSWTKLGVLLGAVAVLGTGCGDDGGPGTTTSAEKSPLARVNVASFLLKPGEEPGFGEVQSPQSAAAAEESGLPPEGVEQLKRNGFVSTAYAPMSAGNGNGGVSAVTLFKTESGALAQLAYETSTKGIRAQLADAARREGVEDLSKDAKLRRFEVSDIPTARGWTGLDIHGNRIGNLAWVQGRCMINIANEGKGGFVEPLAAGAKAIYTRTQGRCP